MRNTVKILVLGMMAVGLAVMLGACGAMKKIKERERSDRLSVVDERISVADSMQLRARWLLDGRSTESGVLMAMMESDSLIVFDPQYGFELQGGRVLYRQATEGSSLLRASADLAMERSADSVAERDAKEEVHLRSAATDKTREGRSIWLWFLPLFIGVLGISLLVLRKFKWSLK